MNFLDAILQELNVTLKRKEIYDAYADDHIVKGAATNVKYQDTKQQEVKQEAGKRFDYGKLRYDLLPVDSLREVVKVYTKGAEKYSDRNWEKGMSWSRCMGPLMRHLEAFREGKVWDDGVDPVTGQPNTGCHHMAMVAWNALALCSYQLRNIGTNDLGWSKTEEVDIRVGYQGQPGPTNSPKEVKEQNERTTGTTATTRA